MKSPSRFINKSKGEDLFKEIAGVERFERGLWEHVQQLSFEYFAELAKVAGEKAKSEGRTVIDIADIQPISGVGPTTPTPEELLEQLHELATLDVTQVAKFGKLIDSWVDTEKSRTS